MSQKRTSTLWKRAHSSEYELRSLDFSQTLLFVQTTQVAVGLFYLPRVVVEAAGHSGWIAVLINGLFMQAGLVLNLVLMRRFESLSLYQIMRRVLGRWLGLLFGGIFTLYCITVAVMVSRSYIEAMQGWLFPTTSTKMFYVLLMIPALYCATGGPRVIGRFAVVTCFATIWMTLILIKPISMIQTDYYFPVLETTLPEMAKATWSVFSSNLGFELLMIIYPFIQRKDKVMLASSLGIWTTTTIYLVVVVVAIGFFGEGLIRMTLSPTLDMFMVVEVPLLQRIEHIGISTWSFLVVGTAAAYNWAAGRFFYEITKWKESTCILIFFPLLYLAATSIRDLYMLSIVEKLAAQLGAVLTFGLPALLLLVAIIRKQRGADDGSPQQGKAQEGAA